VRTAITGRVHIDVKLYPKRPLDWQTRQRKLGAAWDDGVMCIDIDNANKVLLDALKDVAIEDDKWVRRLTSERMEPDGEARVVVTINSIPVAQPQASLLGEAA
jgi:crossover junction endodeoxyribonuclease RusA